MSKAGETMGRTRRIGGVASALLIAVGFFGVSLGFAGLACGQPPAETTDKSQQQELLRAKLAEIARLQAEVERLRQTIERQGIKPPSSGREQPLAGPESTAGGSVPSRPNVEGTEPIRQILVRLKVLAVNLEELKQAGFDLLSLRQLLESDTPTSFLIDDGAIAKFLTLLCEQRLVKTLAAGRRASFATNGLQYECTPTLAADGAFRLKIFLQLDGVAGDTKAGEASATLPSTSGSIAFATVVDVKPAQTLILAGSQRRENGSTTGLLVLVRAESVRPEPDHLTSPRPCEAAPAAPPSATEAAEESGPGHTRETLAR
jgi:hypothetical protein